MPIKGVKAGQPRSDNETVIWDIYPGKTALLVVDMQECFCNPSGSLYSPQTAKIVPNINRLAAFCRRVGTPVVWIREQVGLYPGDWKHYYDFLPGAKAKDFDLRVGNPGSKLFKKLDSKAVDWEVVKNRFSPFAPNNPSHPNLDRLLSSNDIDTVIVTGTDTNVCCDNTARDAMNLDYKVIMVSDACCSYDNALHEATLETLKSWYAMVCTTDELIEIIQTQTADKTRVQPPATR